MEMEIVGDCVDMGIPSKSVAHIKHYQEDQYSIGERQ